MQECANQLKTFQTALKQTSIVLWVQDTDLRYKWIFNPAEGFDENDVINRTDTELLDPDSAAGLVAIKNEVINSGKPAHRIVSIRREGKEEVYELHLNPLLDADGRVIGLSGASVEVTHLMHRVPHNDGGPAPSLLDPEDAPWIDRTNLRIREINHRVKNSLALLESVIRMQRRDSADDNVRAVLTDLECRVRAITDFHGKLDEGSGAEAFEFDQYLQWLCSDLAAAIDCSGAITVEVVAEPGEIMGPKALHLGLVATELVTNALKHVGANVPGARVSVGFARAAGGGWRLSVEDNGRGLPPDFDPEQSTGLGMRIVLTLVRSLGGVLIVERLPKGARFVVEIPAGMA